MTDKERASEAVVRLKSLYPDSVCSLEYDGEPWKLLVMGRLSAQCTDARVNITCRELFSRFPTARALADADLGEIENIVRPCGLYRVKASDIKAECMLLEDKYGGKLPDTTEDLLTFPGVGRKIANLLLGDIFGKPGIVADTHCIRICGRLGFYPETQKDPVKTEKTMSSLIEGGEQSDFCHRLVLFGRETCRAKSPDCENCRLSDICKHNSAKENR